MDGDPTPTLTHPTSWISTFRGKRLLPYIWRDYSTSPPFKQILQHFSQVDYPIDYVYLQPCHVHDVNHLLSQLFWPHIDGTPLLLDRGYSEGVSAVPGTFGHCTLQTSGSRLCSLNARRIRVLPRCTAWMDTTWTGKVHAPPPATNSWM
jgi:hypothetical protein